MSQKVRIPINFKDVSAEDGRRILESAGVQFVGMLLDRFHEIILPPRLMIVRHDPRFAYIVEGKDNLRAIIRSADSPKDESTIELLRRYCVTLDVFTVEGHEYIVGKVFDGNSVIYETERLPLPTLHGSRKKMAEKAADLAIAWIDSRYPNWRSPLAYW